MLAMLAMLCPPCTTIGVDQCPMSHLLCVAATPQLSSMQQTWYNWLGKQPMTHYYPCSSHVANRPSKTPHPAHITQYPSHNFPEWVYHALYIPQCSLGSTTANSCIQPKWKMFLEHLALMARVDWTSGSHRSYITKNRSFMTGKGSYLPNT